MKPIGGFSVELNAVSPSSGGGSGTPGGSSTQVQFNDAGSFGGNSAFTFNKSTGALVLPGAIGIDSSGNITGVTSLAVTDFSFTTLTGTIPAVNGGLGLDASGSTGFVLDTAGTFTFIGSSGTGNVVRVTSPTLVTPALGTPTALVLTNATALPAAQVSSGALTNGMTATTQTVGDNTTKLATTAFVLANGGASISGATSGQVVVANGTTTGTSYAGFTSDSSGNLEAANITLGNHGTLTTSASWLALGASNDIIFFDGGSQGNIGVKYDSSVASISRFELGSAGLHTWSNSLTDMTGTIDLAIGRAGAGILEVNNGTAGTLAALKSSTHTTSAPAGASAGTWKLGSLVTGLTLTANLTQAVYIDIGGTVYKLLTGS